jgi:hypothetical protein
MSRFSAWLQPHLLWWGALVLVSALAWFQAGRGLAFRLGLDGAEAGVGVALAAAVALTLVRWARGDVEARALAALECPTCHGSLTTRHEHATGAGGGRQFWSCANCGLERTAGLTCPACAA